MLFSKIWQLLWYWSWAALKVTHCCFHICEDVKSKLCTLSCLDMVWNQTNIWGWRDYTSTHLEWYQTTVHIWDGTRLQYQCEMVPDYSTHMRWYQTTALMWDSTRLQYMYEMVPDYSINVRWYQTAAHMRWYQTTASMWNGTRLQNQCEMVSE